ncbi:MAG: polysaccharide deacetylase family protein [Cytophagales bacterium]|nr:polysaccharide deacetylase family protein [Cytophagales bacterium]
MFIHKIPSFISSIFPRFTWSKETDNEIYLTFDDGPTPEITDFVLESLAEYNAKATFFCIGKNVESNPSIISRIISGGHSIGNHTMHHYNAWNMDFASYLKDIELCDQLFQQNGIQSIGFRPPYGRITPKMYQQVPNIILWSVLTGDYNASLQASDIVNSIKPYLKPGAIVVMHDSVKAYPHLKNILPEILTYCSSQNLRMSAL